MNKKASLELGVNSIVILILAFAVLGLGLAFIRGLIGQGQEKLGEAIDVNQLEVKPNSDTPIVMIPRTVNIKAGDTQTVSIGVYNTGSGPINLKPGSIVCVGDGKNLEGGQINITAINQTIPAGESAAYKAFITAANAGDENAMDQVSIGNYVCSMDFSEMGDYQFNLNVVS